MGETMIIGIRTLAKRGALNMMTTFVMPASPKDACEPKMTRHRTLSEAYCLRTSNQPRGQKGAPRQLALDRPTSVSDTSGNVQQDIGTASKARLAFQGSPTCTARIA